MAKCESCNAHYVPRLCVPCAVEHRNLYANVQRDYIISALAMDITVSIEAMPNLAAEVLGRCAGLGIDEEAVLQRASLNCGKDIRPQLRGV